jgi:hypothetical protein
MFQGQNVVGGLSAKFRTFAVTFHAASKRLDDSFMLKDSRYIWC